MSETANKSARGPLVDVERMIKRAYGNPQALSRRFRARRFDRIKSLIDDIIAREGACRIADIGGSAYYWDIARDFVETRAVEITLVNTDVRDEGVCGKFAHLRGDAADLGFLDDMSFDFIHSNSVIEHVGDWDRRVAMAGHVRRLAPVYYLQTPYFWFPYEPHFRSPFFHWLPEQVRYRLVMRFALGFSDRKDNVDAAMRRVQSARLLDAGQLRALFPDAELLRERVGGLTKSLVAIRR